MACNKIESDAKRKKSSWSFDVREGSSNLIRGDCFDKDNCDKNKLRKEDK